MTDRPPPMAFSLFSASRSSFSSVLAFLSPVNCIERGSWYWACSPDVRNAASIPYSSIHSEYDCHFELEKLLEV